MSGTDGLTSRLRVSVLWVSVLHLSNMNVVSEKGLTPNPTAILLQQEAILSKGSMITINGNSFCAWNLPDMHAYLSQ